MNENKNAIWILEDEAGARFVIEEVLEGIYPLRFFENLPAFAAALDESERPSLLIADLRLGKDNFADYISDEKNLEAIRAPFIIVSSVDDLEVLRTCFEQGALDYLTKPFTKNALIVKIEQILKKASELASDTAPHQGVILDAPTLTVKRDQPGHSSVQLTAKELRIFSLLHRARGRAISRKELLDEVWSGATVTAKTLDVHLFHLRKKLSKIGIGIKFTAPDGYSLVTDPAETAKLD